MAKVNYVRECRAFLRFSCQRGLTGNEVVLWHALFELMNQEARGGDWPDGFVPLSNARVLSFTTFGSGDSACETLRRARERLAKHGLIKYRRGRRQSAPPGYCMVYFEAETPCNENGAAAAQRAPEDGAGHSNPWPRNASADNASAAPSEIRGEESLGKALGSPLGKALGNPLDIPVNLNGNPNPNPVTHTHLLKGDCLQGAAAPGERLPEGERDAGGEAFDAAWKTSAKARGAVAQRLIDRYDGLMDAPDAWGDLCELMEHGMPPHKILREMPTRPSMSRLVARLRALALCGAGTG